MSSEEGSSYPVSPPDHVGFETDLRTLSNSDLRKKYKGEASSHANMKVRCKEEFELDPAWENFRDFLRDMGPRPTAGKYSIDRITASNKKYGPGLCRWATDKEQTENRTNTIWVDFEGDRITLTALAGRLGVHYQTLYSAHARGLTVAQLAAHFAHRTFRYCPDYILGNDDAVNEWLKAFKAWREKISSDRRWMAEPEVFDVITCSRHLQKGAEWLTRKGFFELTEDERLEAEALLETPYGVAWRHGRERIRKALRALVERAPSVAARIAKAGHSYDHFIRFADWLESPSDPER